MFGRILTGLTLLVLTSMSSHVLAAGSVMQALGQIQQVNMVAQQVTISGRHYVPAPELRVSIGGSFGAFSLLEPGMKVRLSYQVSDIGQRELLEVTEVAPDHPLDES